MNKEEIKKNEYLEKKKELDLKIDNENRRIKLLEQLNFEFEEISKGFTRCIEKISTSMQSSSSTALYDDFLFCNRENMKKFNELVGKDVSSLKSCIADYNNQKLDLEKKI